MTCEQRIEKAITDFYHTTRKLKLEADDHERLRVVAQNIINREYRDVQKTQQPNEEGG